MIRKGEHEKRVHPTQKPVRMLSEILKDFTSERDAVLDVRNEVVNGMQMHMAMRTTMVFPDMLTQMVMIGEEAGSIDDMLAKIAGIYQQEVDDAVDGLSSMLEPLIMVCFV